MGIDGTTLIKDGWFMEKNDMWPGQAMSLKVDKVLHHSKSALQDVLVFSSSHYGNVLVLDGVIQCTERDEFSYQEMLAHLPMFSHPNPEHVLVIGGGDGGVVREVLKHDRYVRSVTLCEIDPVVTQVARKFLPEMASCLDNDTRVQVINGDGAKFLDEHHDHFDIIITDSSDPVGPAQTLFEESFYKKLKAALRPNGIICSQGECIWLHMHLIKPLMKSCKTIFPVVHYAYTTIPTYPSGQIGFIICSTNESTDLSTPLRANDVQNMLKSLKYYNAQIHSASLVLPEFARRSIEGEEKRNL